MIWNVCKDLRLRADDWLSGLGDGHAEEGGNGDGEGLLMGVGFLCRRWKGSGIRQWQGLHSSELTKLLNCILLTGWIISQLKKLKKKLLRRTASSDPSTQWVQWVLYRIPSARGLLSMLGLPVRVFLSFRDCLLQAGVGGVVCVCLSASVL